MLELVMWSFAMALTPLALGLLWRLVSGAWVSGESSLPGSERDRVEGGVSSGSLSVSHFHAFVDVRRSATSVMDD